MWRREPVEKGFERIVNRHHSDQKIHIEQPFLRFTISKSSHSKLVEAHVEEAHVATISIRLSYTFARDNICCFFVVT
jgi:hypothetical protein